MADTPIATENQDLRDPRCAIEENCCTPFVTRSDRCASTTLDAWVASKQPPDSLRGTTARHGQHREAEQHTSVTRARVRSGTIRDEPAGASQHGNSDMRQDRSALPSAYWAVAFRAVDPWLPRSRQEADTSHPHCSRRRGRSPGRPPDPPAPAPRHLCWKNMQLHANGPRARQSGRAKRWGL